MKAKSTNAHRLETPFARLWAWVHFYLKDHHLLRIWWWSMAEIAPGVWRSNQPSPGRLRRYYAMGIRSVASLRSKRPRSFDLLERRACDDLGIAFHRVTGATARELTTGAVLLGCVEALAQIERPFVIHCKSGADRTGFMSALFLILVEGVPVAEGAKQLARKHVHFERSKAGVLDHVFRVYLRDVEPGGQGFRDWLGTGYDPVSIQTDFEDWRKGAGRWAA